MMFPTQPLHEIQVFRSAIGAIQALISLTT